MGIAIGGATVPKRWCVLPDGWNDAWQSAKGGSGTAPAWLTIIGDSVSAGAVSSDYVNNAWAAKLRSKLLSGYSLYGDFWPTSMSVSFATFGGTPPWVVGATAPTWYRWGMGTLPLFGGTPASPILTFTAPNAGTDLDLIYFDFAAGTFTWTVDGVAQATVTTTGAGYHKRVQVAGLANTTHTVVLTGQSANYVALWQGIATYGSRTRGIGFGRIAYSGGLAVDYAGNGNPPDPCKVWQGYGAATTGFGFPTQPSLAIIELGINDCSDAGSHSGGCGPTQYRRVLARLVQAFRRGAQNCSIVILGASHPDGV